MTKGHAPHAHVDLPSNIPGVSQLKSAFQAVCGDTKGALETQKEFTKGCPIVSQIRSAIEASRGDKAAAKKTQLYQLKVIRTVVGKAPVVGQAKAAYHYATGNKKKAVENLTHSSRSTTVLVLGAVGTVASLPLGPAAPAVGAACGVAGGLMYDGLLAAFTGIKSGYVAICSDIEKGNMTPGKTFNAILMPIGDALMGKTGGELASMSVDAAQGADVSSHDGSAHGQAADISGQGGAAGAGHSTFSPLQPNPDFAAQGYGYGSGGGIGYADGSMMQGGVVYVDGQAYSVLYAVDASAFDASGNFSTGFENASAHNSAVGYGDGSLGGNQTDGYGGKEYSDGYHAFQGAYYTFKGFKPSFYNPAAGNAHQH